MILGEIPFKTALNAVNGALFGILDGIRIWCVTHSVGAGRICIASIYGSCHPVIILLSTLKARKFLQIVERLKRIFFLQRCRWIIRFQLYASWELRIGQLLTVISIWYSSIVSTWLHAVIWRLWVFDGLGCFCPVWGFCLRLLTENGSLTFYTLFMLRSWVVMDFGPILRYETLSQVEIIGLRVLTAGGRIKKRGRVVISKSFTI